MDPVKVCPKCGSNRIVSITECVKRENARTRTTIEYYACLRCWYKWDAVGADSGAVIPAGIEARHHG